MEMKKKELEILADALESIGLELVCIEPAREGTFKPGPHVGYKLTVVYLDKANP
jgi:hypothetical protein